VELLRFRYLHSSLAHTAAELNHKRNAAKQIQNQDPPPPQKIDVFHPLSNIDTVLFIKERVENHTAHDTYIH